MPEPVRLNKFLAENQGLSRRRADEYIESGRVYINGKPAILGARLNLETDVLVLNGETIDIKTPTKFVYLMLNKPINFVSSRKQQGGVQTIYSLLPEKYHDLKPVGRLDKDSSGLLLLTNDGDFAFQMTHPKFYKTKVYEVRLDKPLEPLHQQMISDHGVTLPDGPSKLLIAKKDNDEYEITMHEGRNRQIRRTFAALGYMVTDLHRTQFGAYGLNELTTGKFQEVILK